jgi:hypothetical protein
MQKKRSTMIAVSMMLQLTLFKNKEPQLQSGECALVARLNQTARGGALPLSRYQ